MTDTHLMGFGAVITSILASSAFIAALVIAYLSHDMTNLQMLIGMVGTNFATVVSFWLGSSAGSQKKDAALSAQSKSPSV